jgi:predicted nucleic-acid-binding Zn-ribbon protein
LGKAVPIGASVFLSAPRDGHVLVPEPIGFCKATGFAVKCVDTDSGLRHNTVSNHPLKKPATINKGGYTMKQGKCPKCGSLNIYSAEDLPLKSGPFGSNSIPVSLTAMAALDNYVCVDCGLVESYVTDEYMLKKIAKKWKAVNDTTVEKD